ncbi:MAG: PCRF domain-containing protein, partial [Planctomycetes bacterium]|nr:PCRF domain-containing protein [Planctomycetota bacterium]
MIEVLRKRFERFQEIEGLIQQPDVIANTTRYSGLLKERGALIPQANLYRDYAGILKQIADNEELIKSAGGAEDELVELAREELKELQPKAEALREKAQEMLLLDDETSARSCIVEIRAGTGGDEASLFANDLFSIYSYFATRHDLKIEVMDRAESELGGIKSMVFRVDGVNASKWFRYEGGTHRVQRVPATETQGRIHTSAATVAVLPEPEDIDVKVDEKDLEVVAARSGGPGGQNVNKVASKCQILHKPSGIRVECQETKSFHQNRERAMALLRAKLYEVERMRIESERSQTRLAMIGSGDRSEKIRTYNWPQSRCTDHRCKCTITLQNALAGNIDEIIT